MLLELVKRRDPFVERWKPTDNPPTNSSKCACKFTMKNAKRMVLISEDMLDKYEQKQRLETSPIMNNMLHKDTAM